MPTHPDKTIPELLLKLKNALEKGETPIQEELNETSTLDVHSLEKISQENISEQSSSDSEPIHPNADAKKESMTPPIQASKTTIKADPKHIPFNKNERVKAALDWLKTTFPSVFNTEACLPLKIGISHDITAWIASQSGVASASVDGETDAPIPAPFPTKTAIRDALSFYTHSLRYQKSILENDKRYDLTGNEAGVVDADHKEYADQRKAAIEAIIHTRKMKRLARKERRRPHVEKLQEEKQKNE